MPALAPALALALALALGVADAPAADGELRPLAVGGRAVDFLSWREGGARSGVESLALPAGERERYAAEGHPYVERLRRYSFEFRDDGTVHEHFVRARLFLTRDGLRSAGELETWVDAHAERLVVESAYTLGADGARIAVDPATVQVTIPAEDDLFTDQVLAVVPFPGLAPGAHAVLAGTRVHHDTDFPMPWSRVIFPQIFEPVAAFVVDIAWQSEAVRPAWHGDLDGLECRPVAERRVRCETGALEPYADDPDVVYRDVLPALVIAERAAWAAIADRMRALVDGSLGGDALAALARDLAPEEATPEQRVAALHRFVTEEIRYVGLEQGIGGIVPRPSTVTLARRYGDCKDMTTLFVDLARHAGLDAYPVLSASGRYDPAKLALPASGYFDHMIACVAMPSGAERCVDLTDPYSPATALPAGLQGTVRLDLREGVERPTRLAEDDYRWTVTVETVNRLTPDGTMVEEQTRRYPGAFGGWVRGQLASLSAEERVEWGIEDYQEVVSSKVEPEVVVRGVDAPDLLLDVTTTTRFGSFFVPGPRADVADLESWLSWLAINFTSDNEHHGYDFPGTRYEGRTTYVLPPGYAVLHLGPSVDFESDFGRLRRRWEAVGGRVEVTTEFSAARRHVTLDELARFNTFLELVGEETNLDLSIVARDGG